MAGEEKRGLEIVPGWGDPERKAFALMQKKEKKRKRSCGCGRRGEKRGGDSSGVGRPRKEGIRSNASISPVTPAPHLPIGPPHLALCKRRIQDTTKRKNLTSASAQLKSSTRLQRSMFLPAMKKITGM